MWTAETTVEHSESPSAASSADEMAARTVVSWAASMVAMRVDLSAEMLVKR